MKKDVVAEREEQFLSYQDATFGANNPGGRATQSLRLSRVFVRIRKELVRGDSHCRVNIWP